MHPQYSPQNDEEEEFDAMPDELKDHMWAAFAHQAGLGPHPGLYNGPERKPEATPRALNTAPPKRKKRRRPGEAALRPLRGKP